MIRLQAIHGVVCALVPKADAFPMRRLYVIKNSAHLVAVFNRKVEEEN